MVVFDPENCYFNKVPQPYLTEHFTLSYKMFEIIMEKRYGLKFPEFCFCEYWFSIPSSSYNITKNFLLESQYMTKLNFKVVINKQVDVHKLINESIDLDLPFTFTKYECLTEEERVRKEFIVMEGYFLSSSEYIKEFEKAFALYKLYGYWNVELEIMYEKIFTDNIINTQN